MNRVKKNVSISLRQSCPPVLYGLMLGGVLVFTVALSACGGGGGSGGGSPTSTGSGSGGTGTGTGTGSSQAAASPVVYLANQDVFEKYELYLADPAVPGGSLKLNGPLVTDANVNEFVLTQAGDAVVYTADQNTVNRTELYIVNLATPGATTRINRPLVFNRDVIDFAVSPDGKQVVYRADQTTDNVFELYLVSVSNPGESVKLSDGLVAGGWVRGGFSFSPDGKKVLYRADQDAYDKTELYLVEVASPGVSQKLNSPLVTGGNVYSAFTFSPDGATVGYVADQSTDEMLELYSVAVATPGVTQKLNGSMIPAGDVCRFEFSPDSTRVAYCADQQTDEVLELFTVPLNAPGNSVKLNAPLVAGGEVTSGYDFSPDSSFVVYSAKQESPTRTDLFRVDIAAPGVTTQLNPAMSGNITGFLLRPDGSQVGYIANQESASVYELYEVNFQAAGVATKLSAPMQAEGLYSFRYSADGKEVVYLADQDSGAAEVYRVEVASPTISKRLSGTLVTGGEVWDYQVAE